MKAREYFIDGITVKQYADGDVIVYTGTKMQAQKFWHIHFERRLTRRKAKDLASRWRWSADLDRAVEAFR